jgi:hypothetical protein
MTTREESPLSFEDRGWGPNIKTPFDEEKRSFDR